MNILSSRWWAGLWLMLAAAVSAQPTQQPLHWPPVLDSGEYRILQALYGTAQRHIDVTSQLRELARRDRQVRLGNDLFGTDPDPGRVKSLRIYARGAHGRTRLFEYTEGGLVDGAQFSGWSGGGWGRDEGWTGGWGGRAGDVDGDAGRYRILQALYGTAERNVDVTVQLRDLARTDQRFRVGNQSFGGVDPHIGRSKTLRIHARGPTGQIRTFDYNEGGWVDGREFSGWAGGWATDSWTTVGLGAPAAGSGLVIVSAEYGVGPVKVDITRRLQSRVRDGRLAINVSNEEAGQDPAPGAPKTLTLVWRVDGGPEQRRLFSEGQYLSLP